MNQNSVLVENITSQSTHSNYKQSAKDRLSASHGQRILIPEVSNLITSVDRLTSQNFELLKMARIPENDFGIGLEVYFATLRALIKLRFRANLKILNLLSNH